MSIGAACRRPGRSELQPNFQNKQVKRLNSHWHFHVAKFGAYSRRRAHQRLEQGELVRTDGFFDPNGTLRSDAEEVAESVLLKSQREPEERKIPYMGHLFAAVAFDSQISAQLAHQIIKTAEQLTYRQLCILKLAVVKQSFALKSDNYSNHGYLARDLYQVLYECLDLYHRGLINFGGEVAFGPTDVQPGSMTVQGLGVDVFNLMKLVLVPNEDVVRVATQLK